jgi:hypothetical protein
MLPFQKMEGMETSSRVVLARVPPKSLLPNSLSIFHVFQKGLGPRHTKKRLQQHRLVLSDMVYSTVLHWEDRATEWSGRPDRILLKKVVADAGSDNMISSVFIEGKSKWFTFGGRSSAGPIARSNPEICNFLIFCEEVTDGSDLNFVPPDAL